MELVLLDTFCLLVVVLNSGYLHSETALISDVVKRAACRVVFHVQLKAAGWSTRTVRKSNCLNMSSSLLVVFVT